MIKYSETKFNIYESGSGKWLRFVPGFDPSFFSTRSKGSEFTLAEFYTQVMVHPELGTYTTWELHPAAEMESREELLKRANMTPIQFSTGVTKSTDNSLRVSVGSAYDNMFGDCIAIGFMNEHVDPGSWRVAHFSPARARLIAEHLLKRAEHREATDPGMRCIDK